MKFVTAIDRLKELSGKGCTSMVIIMYHEYQLKHPISAGVVPELLGQGTTAPCQGTLAPHRGEIPQPSSMSCIYHHVVIFSDADLPVTTKCPTPVTPVKPIESPCPRSGKSDSSESSLEGEISKKLLVALAKTDMTAQAINLKYNDFNKLLLAELRRTESKVNHFIYCIVIFAIFYLLWLLVHLTLSSLLC
jgi:hypothetical protein